MPDQPTTSTDAPRRFVVALAFETDAATEEEARTAAARFAAQSPQITHTGDATRIDRPGADPVGAGRAVIELGQLVLRYVPAGTDLDRLAASLPNSTLPETVGTVVDSIGPADPDAVMTVPSAQAAAAAEWAHDAPVCAEVELELRGGNLTVAQGDEEASFNAAGEQVEFVPFRQGEACVAFRMTAAALKEQVEGAAVTSAREVALFPAS